MIEITCFDVNINDTVSIIIGENERDNWNILKDSEPDDIWFHLDDESSPYVIIRNDFIQPFSDSTIVLAAETCKKRSKLRDKERVRVIYCNVSNLKKGKEIGSVNILDYSLTKSITV